jgi:hypothetical protein
MSTSMMQVVLEKHYIPSRPELQTSTTQAHLPMFAGIANFAVFRFQPHQTPGLAQPLPQVDDPALNENLCALGRWS